MTIGKMLKRSTGARSGPVGLTPPRNAAALRKERLESEAEIAGYIAQLTAEMGQMAQSARFDLLAYFLSLAKLEAETIQRRPIMDEFGSP